MFALMMRLGALLGIINLASQKAFIRIKACGQPVCGYLTSDASCTEEVSGHRF